MIIGYYDIHGFGDLIEGDATLQTGHVNDAIANDEHYNDYSLPKDYYPNLENDNSGNGTAHESNCIADFMMTSWSSRGNYWGWSWLSDIDGSFTKFVKMRDERYIYEAYFDFYSNDAWDLFKANIDQNKPMILLVDTDGDNYTDHFATAIGYNESDTTYAIFNTWDEEMHWHKWRGMGNGTEWGIYSISMFDIQFGVYVEGCDEGCADITGEGGYDYGESVTVSAFPEDDYVFVSWTEDGSLVSTSPDYTFTATTNRSLTAHFEHAVGIEENKDTKSSIIFPNPTEDILNVEMKNIQTVVLRDLSGKILLSNNYNGKNNVTISTKNLQNGMYLMTIIGKDESETGKIIVAHE